MLKIKNGGQMRLIKYFLTTIASLIIFSSVSFAEKWDMALAYGAGNFHSANATEFAKNVTKKSGGKLQITHQKPLFVDVAAVAIVVYRSFKPPGPDTYIKFYRENDLSIKFSMLVEIEIDGMPVLSCIATEKHHPNSTTHH